MERLAETDSVDSTDYAAARDEGAHEEIDPLKSENGAEDLKCTPQLMAESELPSEAFISDPNPPLVSPEQTDATLVKKAPCIEAVDEGISETHATELQRPCMECWQRNAQCYCVTCDSEICDDCNRSIHSPRILAGHERLHISLKPSPPHMCKVHEGEVVKLFCTESECREPVCVLCGFGAHQKHSCRVIEDVVTLEKKYLNTHIAVCNNRIAQLRERDAEIDRAEALLQASGASASLKLKEDFDAARELLNKWEAMLTSKLDVNVEKLIQEFQTLHFETNEQLNTLTSAIDNARRVSDEGEMSFLSLLDEIGSQVKSTGKAAGKALSAFKAVSTYELDYQMNVKKAVENSACLSLRSLVYKSLNRPLQKPVLGQDLVVSGTVVLSPFLTARDQAAVPLKYESITVKKGGVLTVRAWEGLEKKGGVLALDISGWLLVEEGGCIDVSGRGFRGGAVHEISKEKPEKKLNQTTNIGIQGESGRGPGTFGMGNNEGGGGGAGSCAIAGSFIHTWYGSSGGGFGSAGEAGVPPYTDGPCANNDTVAKGGSIYGSESLDDVDMLHHKLLGSGGGSGVALCGRSREMDRPSG
jgi:hypothetical protein